jgi:hypothetical protein
VRIYSQTEEEKIRAQGLVREWQRSGLLQPPQAAQLEADLRVDLRRTNIFLRLLVFLFTTLVIAVAALLVMKLFHVDGDVPLAAICVIGGALCLGAAEFLIKSFRLYRFGVEEALAVTFTTLVTIAAGLLAPSRMAITGSGDFPMIAMLAAGALASFWIYLRFGYVYGAIASLIHTAALPFPLSLPGETRRLIAAVGCAAIFAIVRRKRVACGDEFPGDDYSSIQATAWAGLYFALNLHVGVYQRYEQGLFYWVTYGMMWVLPVIGLWLALPGKDRLLMNTSLAMALVTLFTNKPYLNLPRQPADPILFGLFLIAAAVLVKRWLARGPDNQRRGFTAKRLLAGDRRTLAVLSTAAVALQPSVAAAESASRNPNFEGGRSGGAGASGSF